MSKRIAFQGARGAFSEMAARELVVGEVEYLPCERFEQMYEAVRDSAADYAAVPMENTLYGSVHENYDLLRTFRLPIVAEARLRIVHNLIGMPTATIGGLTKVISHPVALGQCLQFFRDNPGIASEVHYDTAGSVADMMRDGKPEVASIASSIAADVYGAQILRPSIEDDRQNFTRFFLIAREAPEPPADGPLKTSIVFGVKNTAGALFRCLAAFALRDINMTKLESRPLRGKPWEYLFYMDFMGSPQEEPVRHAIRHLSELTDELVVLGCYPAATSGAVA